MKRTALYSLCICTFLVRPSFAQNLPSTPEQAAVEESIRRQAYKIELERKLDDAKIADMRGEKIAANTLVQNGKFLYEAGKLDAAEKQLQQAVRVDPGNKAAYYYLDLLRDQRFRDQSSARENWSKGMMLAVARAWNEPIKRE